jgi:hypothetical protein
MKKLSEEKKLKIESHIPEATRIANVSVAGMPIGDKRSAKWNWVYHGAMTDLLVKKGLRVK